MITSYLIGDKLVSTSPEAFSLYEKSFLGEKKNNKVEYSNIEALFLIQERKMVVLSKKKEIDSDILIKKFKKNDKKIETKLVVFSDLRKKGYIVKSALKFGAEFRVYEKGYTPKEEHAKWLLYTTKEHDSLTWHDFAAKNRVANSTKKALLIAIVDDESDVSYYECSWTKT